MVAILKREGWGRMYIRREPTPYKGEKWGFDNGVYSHFLKGEPFDDDKYLFRLDRAYRVGTPYLSVAPDIVGGGEKSLELSMKWMDKLPAWPWYLAVQDGMTEAMVRPVLNRFDGLFLGGSNGFKATAYHWRVFAHAHGKKFHYGRAGTARKIQHAIEVGADSADSAFPLWTIERLAETIKYVKNLEQQGCLWDTSVSAKNIMGGE